MNKLITVIIVNYFSSNDLVNTLDSLRNNQCYDQLETHVIDNSCNEDESLALKQLAEEKSFILRLADKNLGFGAACNHIYHQTQCPYVFLINPDAYLLDNALDKLLFALQHNHSMAAAGPKTFWSDQLNFILPPSLTFSPVDYFISHYQHSFFKQLLWLKSLLLRRKAARYWQSRQPLAQENLSGGGVLLRRSAIENAGGLFDEDFYMYFEDSDLFKRLRQQGNLLHYIPESQIVHKFSGCARDQQVMKNEFMANSHQVFFSKHYPDNRLVRLAEHSAKNSQTSLWQPELINLGTLSSANEIVIHLPKASHYLVEWSPSLFFLPAAGLILNGDTFHLPAEIWPILPAGDHYLRIAELKSFWVKPRVWHWIKN